MSKSRIALTLLFGASLSVILVACGSAQPGTAVAVPAAAKVTITKIAPSVAPTTKPKPVVTATVTQTPDAQPTIVIVPAPAPATTVYERQDPTTVYQQPETQYVPDPTYSSAQYEINEDRSTAESMVGSWIPQLGAYGDDSDAMTRFYRLQQMSGGYTDVFMVSSTEFSSFTHSGYDVILLPRTFSSASDVNAWCDAEHFATDNCMAKRLSHSDGPTGNSLERH